MERDGDNYIAISRLASHLGAMLLLIAQIAYHPTATELADGRVQVTLTAEEWRAIREASR